MQCAIENCEAEAALEPRVKTGPGQFTPFPARSVCRAHGNLVASLFADELVDAEGEPVDLCIQVLPRRGQ